MKKVKVWLAALVALVVGVCCLAACGSGVEGTYKFYSMTVEGQTLHAGESYMGVIQLSEDFVVLELKKDGTCTMKTAMAPQEAGSATWKVDENDKNKIIVTAEDEDGESVTFTKNGNELSFEMEGSKVVLKK